MNVSASTPPGRAQGLRAYIRPVAEGIAAGLRIRDDHGSQYISDHFQSELRFLGAESSPSFIAAREGDGIAERFMRTLKERFVWVHGFETIEDLRRGLLAFRDRYNKHRMLGRHGYLSPAEIDSFHARRWERYKTELKNEL